MLKTHGAYGALKAIRRRSPPKALGGNIMKKPVVLVVMDGVGDSASQLGNMVQQATTPTLDELKATCPYLSIKAHGTAVGLPSDDDMGNSEVGHNALGCGQIYSQGAKLVNESIESGKIYASQAWKELIGCISWACSPTAMCTAISII